MISRKIKDKIDSQRLSVREAARRCGMTQSSLWNVINNKTSPTISTLQKISSGLNIPLEELVKEESDFEEIMSDPELKIMFEKVGKLSPAARKSIIEFINYAYEQEKK